MLNWFRLWRSFQRHDDAYARNRRSLAKSIRSCIQRQQGLGKIIWLVTHDDKIFEHTQQQLAEWQFDYDLVMGAIDVDELLMSNERSEKLLRAETVKLVHSQLIPYTDRREFPRQGIGADVIAMFVLDRHRQIENDDRLESFCRNVPLKFELGYFLSLDDELVSEALDGMTLEVLDQMGMGQHDLITSGLVTMRLNRFLRRKARDR